MATLRCAACNGPTSDSQVGTAPIGNTMDALSCTIQRAPLSPVQRGAKRPQAGGTPWRTTCNRHLQTKRQHPLYQSQRAVRRTVVIHSEVGTRRTGSTVRATNVARGSRTRAPRRGGRESIAFSASRRTRGKFYREFRREMAANCINNTASGLVSGTNLVNF